jgi:nucleoid-associated protein YgaU
MAAPQPSRPSGGGNILTQRLGPLATWVWLLIGTLLVGAIALYLRHKAGNKTSATAGQAAPGQTAGVQQVPDIILQNYEGANTQTVGPTTVNPAAPPVTPPSQPPPEPPEPAEPPGRKPPGKPPVHQPVKPKPPAAQYQTVTVGRWTATPGKNNLAPWNSTLWGIAEHYKVQGGFQELAKLNGIKNPNLIHPGQKIRVPVS